MIFSLDDYIKQKFIEKFNISTNNKKFKIYKKNKFMIASKEIKKLANNISQNFINKICMDKSNKIIFYGINYSITMSEIFGICIYKKLFSSKDKVRYVILLLVINPNVRNFGYGSLFMKEIEDYLNKNKLIEIILHSLKESVLFYQKYGFELMTKSNYNKFLLNYEGIDKNSDNVFFFKLTLPKNNNNLY